MHNLAGPAAAVSLSPRGRFPNRIDKNGVSQCVYSVKLNYNTVDPRPPRAERSTPAITHTIRIAGVAAAIGRPATIHEDRTAIAK